MQTAYTNICERLCHKSICEISFLLNIPHSTVSGIITKWKQLGTTATQPRSDSPRKMTKRGQRTLKFAEVGNCLLSIKTSKLHLAFRLAQQYCIECFMEWVSMAKQLHP
ncbi:unnamed protein product, partial [Staurois parvus]